MVSVICKLSFDVIDVEEVDIKKQVLLYPALENFLPLITVFIFHSSCLKRCEATTTYCEEGETPLLDSTADFGGSR
jgi:hypothetical protein